jgi:oligopeptide/dipeptide ABC transporter ATP-binding protein
MALLEINNLKTHFFTRAGVIKAVDGISFSIEKGEILGIVGESGAGKSITGFSILGLIDKPGEIVEGEIIFDGDDMVKKSEEELQRIRGNEIAMIFQDPQTSLNPVISIGDQLMEAILYHSKRASRKEAFSACVDILKLVGLPAAEKRMKSYPHQLSGGMKQRVVIAMALLNNPKLLIADEPTTALDVTIQAQILYLMKKLSSDFDSSLILITHDIAVVSQLCDKIAVMYAGRIVEYGKKEDIIFNPQHPYTKGLIECLPKLDDDKERLYQIPGIMPSLLSLPQGCYFKNRCEYADKECDVYPPEQQLNGRRIFCHKVK